MKIRRLTLLLIFCLTLNVSGAMTFTQRLSPRPPNIIFILTDDMGYGELLSSTAQAGIAAELDQVADQGPVAAACYGALDTIDLQEGESYVLDSGHLVGYTGTMNFTTRKVAKGWMNTLKSGEGLVMEFTGPGKPVKSATVILVPFTRLM